MKTILPLLLLTLWSTIGLAQERWSLEKCIQYARQNNLDLKQAALNVKSARLTQKGNQWSRLPDLNATVTGGIQFGRTINPVTNSFENVNAGYNTVNLTAGMVLYNGSAITNSIEQSKLDVAAAQADAAQSADNISLNVALAYLNVLFNEDQMANAESRRSLTQSQLEQTTKLIRAGTRPESDRLDIEAQLAQDEQALVNRQNDVTISYLNLKQLLQLAPDYELRIVRPEVEVPADISPNNFSLSAVYNQALGSQPSIQAGELRMKSAELGVKIARANKLPILTAFASTSTNFSSQVPDPNDIITPGEQFLTPPIPAVFEGQDGSGMVVVNEGSVQFLNETAPEFGKRAYFDQFNDNFGQQVGLRLNIPIYNNGQADLAMQRAEVNKLSTELNNRQI
ncbi:MAG: TolC family protein, partial [Bacteroidota bacterium]